MLLKVKICFPFCGVKYLLISKNRKLFLKNNYSRKMGTLATNKQPTNQHAGKASEKTCTSTLRWCGMDL